MSRRRGGRGTQNHNRESTKGKERELKMDIIFLLKKNLQCTRII
jgi:hypothetical protein